jgi:predicted lipid-binding transport protein (Tim44 family)
MSSDNNNEAENPIDIKTIGIAFAVVITAATLVGVVIFRCMYRPRSTRRRRTVDRSQSQPHQNTSSSTSLHESAPTVTSIPRPGVASGPVLEGRWEHLRRKSRSLFNPMRKNSSSTETDESSGGTTLTTTLVSSGKCK